MKNEFCNYKNYLFSNQYLNFYIFILFRNQIKNLECPYIAKFYYNRDSTDTSLYLEYYPFKSLDHFKNVYGYTMSLNTKLYILYQVAQAIKFLKDNQIYHLDLKPGNILVITLFIFR